MWSNCQQKKSVFAPVHKYRKCCGLVLCSDRARPRHNSMINIRVVIPGTPLLFREILKCLIFIRKIPRNRPVVHQLFNTIGYNFLQRMKTKTFFFHFAAEIFFSFSVLLLGFVPVLHFRTVKLNNVFKSRCIC